MSEGDSSETPDEPIDKLRRQFLVGATATVGVVGAAAAGVPFVQSLLPNRQAEAAPT